MSIYENIMILIYFTVLTAIIGAVLGSFLNCAAWRIAHGESFLKGHSRCPKCDHPLGILDLIPILSWCALQGKCRYCGEKISARYPITEMTLSVLMILTLLRFDLTPLCVRNMIFLCCLFCLSLVDLESYIIPDGCLILSVAAWFGTIPFSFLEYGGWYGILWNLAAALLYGGGMLLLALIMDHLLKKESLGGGDIKLFAVMGLYLGLVSSLFALLVSCVLGLLFAIVSAKERKKFTGMIPFGPAIAVAIWMMLLYGDRFVNWYLGLL